jgi:acyl carrier protein
MDIYERVRKIITDQLDVSNEQVTPESSLTDDLAADSLDLVEISMAVEEQFDIHLDDEEAFALKTVGQIVACIQTKTAPAEEMVAGAAQ